MPSLTKTKYLTYKELFCFHVSQQFVPRFCVCVCVCGSHNMLNVLKSLTQHSLVSNNLPRYLWQKQILQKQTQILPQRDMKKYYISSHIMSFVRQTREIRQFCISVNLSQRNQRLKTHHD